MDLAWTALLSDMWGGGWRFCHGVVFKTKPANVSLQLLVTWKRTLFALVCDGQITKPSGFRAEAIDVWVTGARHRFPERWGRRGRGAEAAKTPPPSLTPISHLCSCEAGTWSDLMSANVEPRWRGDTPDGKKQQMCESHNTLLPQDELPPGLCPWNGEVQLWSTDVQAERNIFTQQVDRLDQRGLNVPCWQYDANHIWHW